MHVLRSSMGFSIRVMTCRRWKDSLLYCGNNNSGELYEEHTDGEKYHLLVVVGSFGGVVMIGGLSKVHILHHHQVLVNMESSMVHVIFVLLHHVFWMVLVFPTTSISRESRASFICWSEVACESRKLLTCGKLSFVVACFSTNVRFLVGKETTNALVLALMLKLHALSLDINSSSHTLPKITHGMFKKIWLCFLGDSKRWEEKCCWAEFANTFSYVSEHVNVFNTILIKIRGGIFSYRGKTTNAMGFWNNQWNHLQPSCALIRKQYTSDVKTISPANQEEEDLVFAYMKRDVRMFGSICEETFLLTYTNRYQENNAMVDKVYLHQNKIRGRIFSS